VAAGRPRRGDELAAAVAISHAARLNKSSVQSWNPTFIPVVVSSGNSRSPRSNQLASHPSGSSGR
jgi:hypothetical protein